MTAAGDGIDARRWGERPTALIPALTEPDAPGFVWDLCGTSWLREIAVVGGRLKAIPGWVQAGKPSPTGRKAFSAWRHYTKDDALLPSGLLGPVTLRRFGQDGRRR